MFLVDFDEPAAAAAIALRLPHRLDLVLEDVIVRLVLQARRELDMIVQ